MCKGKCTLSVSQFAILLLVELMQILLSKFSCCFWQCPWTTADLLLLGTSVRKRRIGA